MPDESQTMTSIARVLAIETSAPQGGVALRADQTLIGEILINDQKRHTIEIHPALDALLSQHSVRLCEIDVFGFSVGPGSFTGLRLGATIARLVAAISDAVIIAVPSLEILAHNALAHLAPGTTIAACLDARRGGIFAGSFVATEKGLETVQPALLTTPDEFLATLPETFVALGGGLAVYGAHFKTRGSLLPESTWQPRPQICALLAEQKAAAGESTPKHEIVPHYLRPPACEEVYEAKRAAARERRGE